MSIPSGLVQNYHAITCGQALLTTDGHDFFPFGQEPQVRRSQAVDTPDCAGRTDGELYVRGNVRWTAGISRVREFFNFSYPVTDGAITAATPEEYAQKWLMRHLTALPKTTSALVWTGVREWGPTAIEADGTTDGGFAIVNYSLQMSDAS